MTTELFQALAFGTIMTVLLVMAAGWLLREFDKKTDDTKTHSMFLVGWTLIGLLLVVWLPIITTQHL